MKKEDAISKIKVILGLKDEKKFADAKLKDGSILRYDGETPEVGQAVILITEEGELPAPDGKYELEDGTVLTITGSAIVEVEAPGAEEEAVEEVAPVQDMTTKQTPKVVTKTETKEFKAEDAIKELREELFKKVEEVEAKLVEATTANETLKAENVEMKAVTEAVKATLSKIEGEPVVESKRKESRMDFIKRTQKEIRESIKLSSK